MRRPLQRPVGVRLSKVMLARLDPFDISRRIYETLRGIGSGTPPRLRLWNGEELGPRSSSSTIVLRHPGSLRALLVPATDLAAGEAYVYDDVDIEGNIIDLLRFARRLDGDASPLAMARMAALARALPSDVRKSARKRPPIPGRRHSRRRDRRAVGHHYDTGNGFFESFLGETMVYSCAHFLDPGEGLDIAQRRKLDIVCRKLRLRPGQHLLDVGCGWGSLAIHAAIHYGVEVTGITLSGPQAAYARDRAKQAGVADRVDILERDYREVVGRFDAIASVGMVEHVGRDKLATYFRVLRDRLTPGGAVLNHGIVDRHGTTPRQRSRSFVGTYVFPDGDLLPLGSMISVAEAVGFEVRDVHALRLSYARTLERWVANLEANRRSAVAAASEETYRIWRLYMAGSVVAFERGAIGVDQVLLTDPERPWTYGRAALLAEDDRRPELVHSSD